MDVKFEDEVYFQTLLDSLATLSYSKAAAEQDAATERPGSASKPIEAGDSSD